MRYSSPLLDHHTLQKRETETTVPATTRSNINHDFSARSFERLLGLVKGSLSLLVLKDSPSPGRQEGFEAISGMKNLQELCLEVRAHAH